MIDYRDFQGRKKIFTGQYNGQSVFLVCGGPSLRKIELNFLNKSEIMSMGINNVWSMANVKMWTAQDTPERFLCWGWMNPGIQKFVAASTANSKLQFKDLKGEFHNLRLTTKECPNVNFFHRSDKLLQKDFFSFDKILWAMEKQHPITKEIGYTRNSFIPALQILSDMGFSNIYLLGVDFHMEPDQPYAFDELRAKPTSNNKHYLIIDKICRRLYPDFLKNKIKVFNCNMNSRLKAFPFKSLGSAIKESSLWNKESPLDYYPEKLKVTNPEKYKILKANETK